MDACRRRQYCSFPVKELETLVSSVGGKEEWALVVWEGEFHCTLNSLGSCLNPHIEGYKMDICVAIDVQNELVSGSSCI